MMTLWRLASQFISEFDRSRRVSLFIGTRLSTEISVNKSIGEGEIMQRQIIHIDEAKCNGCGLCAEACHENAIEMVGGKARLIRDDYCDGMGDCLPECPTGAITFETREAAAYDEAAVAANAARLDRIRQRADGLRAQAHPNPSGCPGAAAQMFEHKPQAGAASAVSELRQWPVQIKLVNPEAPYFDGAKLLIAADCSAYAYGNFHRDFVKGRTVIIGCPKFDGDYSDKLTAILRQSEIKSVAIVRMQVPCCRGLDQATKNALAASGKQIPWSVSVVGPDGSLVSSL